MMRGIWIRPSGPTFTPSCVVSVVCETRELPCVIAGNRIARELHSIHVCESHQRRGRWSEPLYLSFTSGADFHDWLESFASIRKRTYCVSPIASNTLTLTGFWDRITKRGSRLVKRGGGGDATPTAARRTTGTRDTPGGRRSIGADRSQYPPGCYHFSGFVLNGKPDILKYRTMDRSFVWCGCNNYFTQNEDDIASAIGYEWPTSSAASTSFGSARRAAGERAFMWLRAFQRLCEFWHDIDGGPWSFSTGGLAYNILRKNIPAKTILNHRVEYAKRLEETAIYGGRRSVWYVGNVGSDSEWDEYASVAPPRSRYPFVLGGMSHVDVRSMYPHILATQQFPVRLLTVDGECSVKDVSELLTQYGVIARVRIRTNDPEYPFRRARDIIYPVGEFTTTLCGPELAAAIGARAITHIYSVCTYAMKDVFSRAANKLLKCRALAIEQQQVAWELFIKHLSNSISGKLAQRKYEWIERPDLDAETSWGRWVTIDADGGIHRKYRAIADMVWEECPSAIQSRPMGAAFAYLTAYGRMMMRTIRSACPDRSILSQDTDGIWIRNNAVESIPLGTAGSEYTPGDLRITKRAKCGRFFGPQHYWYDGHWTLSGFGSPLVDPHTLRIQSREHISPIAGANAAPIEVIYERDIYKHLGSIPIPGAVDDYGWVAPVWVCEPPL